MIRAALATALLVCASTAGAQDGSPVPALERLAERGDAEALYHLGMNYQTGSGARTDHRKALEYFRRAAALGDPLGAYKLGCYHDGQNGVLEPDEAKALAEKLIAAKAGYALAQQDVAAIYARQGNGAEAERWIAAAAAQGWPDALFGYASLRNGRNGLPRDGAIVVAYFSLFLQAREPDAAQQQWLTDERKTLTPEERARADRIIAGYRPQPTALTIKALSGQRAAAALIGQAAD